MGKLEIDVSEVKKLVGMVEKHHLEELTVEHEGVSITVKGRASKAEAPVVAQPSPQTQTYELPVVLEPEMEEASTAEQAAVLEGNIVDIVAPLVGVFYRSSAPDTPPSIEVGDVIGVGAEVGLIEAMKVFSPIPSEVAGEVVDIPAENGKLVREGDVLVRVRIAEE